LGGQSIAEPGALGNPIKMPPLVAMDLPTPSAGQGSTDAAKPNDEAIDAETAEEMVKRKEEEQFQQAEETLRQAIQGIPSLKELSESLVVDDTVEGMRIQIVDQEGLAMFPRGTAEMYDHTQKMLALVAKVIEKMPQKIAIAGHTDSTKFRGEAGYSNWELSADRANASRRALIDMGVPEGRISRVVGKAAEEPLVKNDPANPRNRRITIVLMRGTGDGQAPSLP
jgi:chemotaxis protein MotB